MLDKTMLESMKETMLAKLKETEQIKDHRGKPVRVFLVGDKTSINDYLWVYTEDIHIILNTKTIVRFYNAKLSTFVHIAVNSISQVIEMG
ncbi:hypothetical protein P9X10_00810 [Bacillus cereus]|nr:hypothetical protein [Bacillus cereus]